MTELKITNWNDTTAAKCRWAEYAEPLIGDWLILWEESEADYQGHACVLAYKNGCFRYIEWSYGSCSGCDSYEDRPHDEIKKIFEIDNLMHFKDADTFCNWVNMLIKTDKYKAKSFYDAICVAFKDQNIKWEEHPDKLLSKINTFALLNNN